MMTVQQMYQNATPAQRNAAEQAGDAAWNAVVAAAKSDEYISAADWQAAFNDAYEARGHAYAQALASLSK